MPRFNLVTAVAASMLIATAALAQATPPPSAKAACRSSALALCHDEALAGDRAAVRACLIKNFDKVTPECQAAMKAVQARMMASPDAPPPKP